MRFGYLCSAFGLTLGLAACASVPAAGNSDFSLLRLALTSDAAALQSQVDQGDAKAQFALGLVYRYGLHHVAPDKQRAASLATEALRRRGNTAINQYIPGLNGKPGRTAIINVSKYDITAAEARQTQACADALDHGQVEANSVCGDAQTMQALAELWRQAH